MFSFIKTVVKNVIEQARADRKYLDPKTWNKTPPVEGRVERRNDGYQPQSWVTFVMRI
jgi:ATP-dependent Clp protease adapter protein ClpS